MQEASSTLTSLVEAGQLSDLEGNVRQIQQQFAELEARIKDVRGHVQVRRVSIAGDFYV